MEALTPRKQPRQDRARHTVEAILSAAARILETEGPDALNTNRIASDAGVSVGSLYQYFPNKEAILVALVENHTERMIGILEDTVRTLVDAPMAIAVRTYVRAMVEAHALEPQLHRALVQAALAIVDVKDLLSMERRAADLVLAWLTVHQEKIKVRDLKTASFVLVSAVEATTHRALLEHTDTISSGALEHELCALVLRYLGVDEGTTTTKSRRK
jgi:AcrR family transcriptional regulator